MLGTNVQFYQFGYSSSNLSNLVSESAFIINLVNNENQTALSIDAHDQICKSARSDKSFITLVCLCKQRLMQN